VGSRGNIFSVCEAKLPPFLVNEFHCVEYLDVAGW